MFQTLWKRNKISRRIAYSMEFYVGAAIRLKHPDSQASNGTSKNRQRHDALLDFWKNEVRLQFSMSEREDAKRKYEQCLNCCDLFLKYKIFLRFAVIFCV